MPRSLCLWVLILTLGAGCAALPTTWRPTIGHIDKKPSVLIVRGQDYEICGRASVPLPIVYFIFLRNMPPQRIALTAKDGVAYVTMGAELTVTSSGTPADGLSVHYAITATIAGREYDLSTDVTTCDRGANQPPG